MIITDGKNYTEQLKALIKKYTPPNGNALSVAAFGGATSPKGRDKTLAPPLGELSARKGLTERAKRRERLRRIPLSVASATCCEMKRLYVKPAYRGRKIAEKRIEELIRQAKQAGYQEMILDTIVPL